MASSLVLLSGDVGRKQVWGSFRAVLGLTKACGLMDNWLPSAGTDKDQVITTAQTATDFRTFWKLLSDLAEIN